MYTYLIEDHNGVQVDSLQYNPEVSGDDFFIVLHRFTQHRKPGCRVLAIDHLNGIVDVYALRTKPETCLEYIETY